MRGLRAAGVAVADVLLPPQCMTCEMPVGQQGQLCAACFGRTNYITGACCQACGVPFPASMAVLCGQCVARRPSWGEARAALTYDEQAQRMLLPLKYGDRVEVARALAPAMVRAGAALLARADLVVPVPLHRWRLLARRYNQAALLARAVARLGGRPAVLDALVRVRATVPLGPLSPKGRALAVDGAFEVAARRRAQLLDARVLLVDDVLTTGATAESCARALLDAGAGGVDVLAAARVPDHMPD